MITYTNIPVPDFSNFRARGAEQAFRDKPRKARL